MVELLVVLVLLGIVGVAIGRVMRNMQTEMQRQTEQAATYDALLTAERFLTSLLRGADANMYTVDTLKPLIANPRGTSGSLTVEWEPGQIVSAFDNVQILSDFNPPNGRQNDPYEDATVYVQGDTLYVLWRTVTAGTMTTPYPIATPISSVRFSFFDLEGRPLTTASTLPSSKQIRFRLEAPLTVGRSTRLIRRDRWVYIRNP